jgi:hypothetical protein
LQIVERPQSDDPTGVRDDRTQHAPVRLPLAQDGELRVGRVQRDEVLTTDGWPGGTLIFGRHEDESRLVGSRHGDLADAHAWRVVQPPDVRGGAEAALPNHRLAAAPDRAGEQPAHQPDEQQERQRGDAREYGTQAFRSCRVARATSVGQEGNGEARVLPQQHGAGERRGPKALTDLVEHGVEARAALSIEGQRELDAILVVEVPDRDPHQREPAILNPVPRRSHQPTRDAEVRRRVRRRTIHGV